jgi:hypothetical protein
MNMQIAHGTVNLFHKYSPKDLQLSTKCRRFNKIYISSCVISTSIPSFGNYIYFGMAQSYLMTADHFEQQKNIKAGALTAGICLLIALMLIFVSWQLPQIAAPDPPLEQQGIEVNIGTDETGFGTDQPLLPGDPAPQVAAAPPQTTASDAADDNTADDPASDVPVVKNEKPKVTIKKPAEEVKKTVAATKPVTNPTPAPPKPKAVFNGKTAPNSNGNGGNGADSYYKGSNQGIAGGKGDQGKPGGSPTSDSYTGNGRGNGGIRISSGLGGRNLKGSYTFSDEFNRNATVYVDVVVDISGNVIDAKVSPRGTSTTDSNIKAIAERRARQLKFTGGSEEQRGTLVFNFKVNG